MRCVAIEPHAVTVTMGKVGKPVVDVDWQVQLPPSPWDCCDAQLINEVIFHCIDIFMWIIRICDQKDFLTCSLMQSFLTYLLECSKNIAFMRCCLAFSFSSVDQYWQYLSFFVMIITSIFVCHLLQHDDEAFREFLSAFLSTYSEFVDIDFSRLTSQRWLSLFLC